MQINTVGLIGGIGWASTSEYYRLINEMTVARMGPAYSARIVLSSLNQFDFTSRAAEGNSLAIEKFLIQEGQRLKAAGADFFIFCANGVHRFAPAVVPQIGLPFISIVEETVKQVQASKLKKVGLLGVKATMSGNFYRDQLASIGVDVVVPCFDDQDIIHEIIYSELIHNRITDESRSILVEIIRKLALDGAGGVILGCTEIPLLIHQHDVDIPIFNTTEIHCEAVVKFAFANNALE